MLYANSGIVVKPEENVEELMYQALTTNWFASAEAIKAGLRSIRISDWLAESQCADYPATCRPDRYYCR